MPRRDDDGSAVLETAIVLPAMILLTMLVIQYALVWHARHVAQAAAQEGLRAASSYQVTPADGRTAALTYLRNVAPHLLTSPDVHTTSTGTTMTVTIHADALPLLSFGRFPLTEHATGPRERFVAPQP
jgi:Flp pilus assembly protein TadG